MSFLRVAIAWTVAASGGSPGLPSGRVMPAAGEEAAHAVGPVLAVDEAVVVELAELGLPGCEALQELVEGALPGGEVHRRRARQDAVEVEEAGADGVREAERPGSWHGADATGGRPRARVGTAAVVYRVRRTATSAPTGAAGPALPRVDRGTPPAPPARPEPRRRRMADRPTAPEPVRLPAAGARASPSPAPTAPTARRWPRRTSAG